jgi:hypothetical protein
MWHAVIPKFSYLPRSTAQHYMQNQCNRYICYSKSGPNFLVCKAKKKALCIILVCKQIEWNLNCFKIWYRRSLETEKGKTSWLCDVAANPSARIEFKQARTRLLTAHRRFAILANMGACMNFKWQGSVTRILFLLLEEKTFTLTAKLTKVC